MTPEAMRIAIAESDGWSKWAFGKGYPPQKSDNYPPAEPPNYPFDFNAILPLLPHGVRIDRDREYWYLSRQGFYVSSNQSLALAACEFYLKWKGLWRGT